jgi:hypothetical protein
MRTMQTLRALLWEKSHPTNTEWMGVPPPKERLTSLLKVKVRREGLGHLIEEVVRNDTIEH